MGKFRSSILFRFLMVFVPVFLLATASALLLGSKRHVEEASNYLSARIGAQMGRISQKLDQDMVIQNPESVRLLTSGLAADQAVTCISIYRGKVFEKSVSHPRNLGCERMAPEESIRLPSAAGGVSIVAGFSQAEVDAVRMRAIQLTIGISIIALCSAGLAGYLAFRRVVGKRLEALLLAIRKIAAGDTAERIPDTNSDELSEVCTALNVMHERLCEAQMVTRRALEDVARLYNSTPALLFTLDEQGVITRASDFLLQETGYCREEIEGRPLLQFLSPVSRSRFSKSALPDLQNGAEIRDLPLTLWKRDGKERDILLSVVSNPDTGDSSGHHVCVMTDVTLLRSAEREMRVLAQTDALTGLPNRVGLKDKLKHLMPGQDGVCCFMFVDLDNFKTINDTYGHQAGDNVIRESATRILAAMGEDGVVARIGGDEFALVCPVPNGRQQAAEIADRIIASVSQPILMEHTTAHVGASVGISFSSDADCSPEEALRLADQAMYLAKHDGKNRYAFYEDERAEMITRRAKRIQLIDSALESHWFDIHFQPIINLKTRLPYAMEALLRIDDPECPIQSIEELIQTAEETGKMVELGNWILDASIERFSILQKLSGYEDLSLSINLSPQQMTESFVHRVRTVLSQHPSLRNRLILEITETAAIRRFDVVNDLLCDMKEAGAVIAIDDFGTGYSSLSYISRLPVDLIKLDKSFLSGRLNSEKNGEPFLAIQKKQQALLRSVILVAHELEVGLVAEGIEDSETALAMNALGANYGQGYAFTPAMSVMRAADWLMAFDADQGEDISVKRAG